MRPMKYWEIVADKLSAAGWSWGYCSAVTPNGWRWIVDAYRSTLKYELVYHHRFAWSLPIFMQPGDTKGDTSSALFLLAPSLWPRTRTAVQIRFSSLTAGCCSLTESFE